MGTRYRLPFMFALLALSAQATAQQSPDPAADLPPAEDACLAAVRDRAPEAERTCSDLIAGLRYDGAATGPGSEALAAALGNRALARMRSGELEGAEADFSEALALAPDAWAIHLNRATLALMSGDAAAALNYLGRVRQLASGEPAVLAAADRNSILAWRMLGNLDAASALSRERPVHAAPARPPG